MNYNISSINYLKSEILLGVSSSKHSSPGQLSKYYNLPVSMDINSLYITNRAPVALPISNIAIGNVPNNSVTLKTLKIGSTVIVSTAHTLYSTSSAFNSTYDTSPYNNYKKFIPIYSTNQIIWLSANESMLVEFVNPISIGWMWVGNSLFSKGGIASSSSMNVNYSNLQVEMENGDKYVELGESRRSLKCDFPFLTEAESTDLVHNIKKGDVCLLNAFNEHFVNGVCHNYQMGVTDSNVLKVFRYKEYSGLLRVQNALNVTSNIKGIMGGQMSFQEVL